jgi:hypothetical protein
MYVGFIIGRKYGWHMRDNKEKARDILESLKKSDALKDYNAVFYKNIKDMEFNIIGLKRKKDIPLSLKEQLQKAIMDEDYELAAKIHNEINKNKKQKPNN